ncbi:MAG: BON domain-containing protein [Rickettsiaceae bacterium]
MSKRFTVMIACFALLMLLTGCIPAVITAATVSTAKFSQDQTTGQILDDNIIATKIKAAFIKRGFKKLYSKITVSVNSGRVLYIGLVSSQQDVLDAIEIAWNIRGVSEVIDELQIKSEERDIDIAQYTRDAMITSQIRTRIMTNKIKSINYNIITKDDVVYIFGLAQNEEEVKKVAEIASKIRKVKSVVSHVKIKNQSTD